MANVNSPFGLQYTRNLSGSKAAPLGFYMHQNSDNVALFRGDSVNTTALGGTSAVQNIPDGTQIVQASGTVTTGAIRGVVEGVGATFSNLTLNYCPASVDLAILVRDDPFALFNIQSNGTVLVDDFGDTMGITSGSGSTTTGISAYVATESTGHADAADVLRVIRLAPLQNNALGANSVIECSINVHELRTTTTA